MRLKQLFSFVNVIILVGAWSVDANLSVANAEQATPEESANLGCTTWVTTGGVPDTPEDCSRSSPWWTSWSNCDMTPVHSEPWPGTDARQSALRVMPWVNVNMGTVTATAHLFFGNRPLPVGGAFPNGDSTKVLWTFDKPVTDFSVTGTNADDSSNADAAVIDTGPANTNNGRSNDWPSSINVPAAGCWTFGLKATDPDGKTVTGSLTFIAVK